MKMWALRWLNWLGLRQDKMVCMHQEDAWCWPSHLGQITEGNCTQCGSLIYYEIQNKPFTKVCNRCIYPF